MNGDFAKKIRNIVTLNNSELGRTVSNRYKGSADFNRGFDNDLDTLVKQIKSDAIVCARGVGVTDIEKFEALLDAKTSKVLLTQGNSHRFQKVKSSVTTYISVFNSLTDEIEQETKHDYASKRRFLLFRVLTTLGIAGAALGMAMFANVLGYETAILKKIDNKPKTEVLKNISKQSLPKQIKK